MRTILFVSFVAALGLTTLAKADPIAKAQQSCEAKYGSHTQDYGFCLEKALNLGPEIKAFKKKGESYVRNLPDWKIEPLLFAAQRKAGAGNMATALTAEGLARGLLSPI